MSNRTSASRPASHRCLALASAASLLTLAGAAAAGPFSIVGPVKVADLSRSAGELSTGNAEPSAPQAAAKGADPTPDLPGGPPDLGSNGGHGGLDGDPGAAGPTQPARRVNLDNQAPSKGGPDLGAGGDSPSIDDGDPAGPIAAMGGLGTGDGGGKDATRLSNIAPSGNHGIQVAMLEGGLENASGKRYQLGVADEGGAEQLGFELARGSVEARGVSTDGHDDLANGYVLRAYERRAAGGTGVVELWVEASDLGIACAADQNDDGSINVHDLIIVFNAFHTDVEPNEAGDVDGNGRVDIADVNAILDRYGDDC